MPWLTCGAQRDRRRSAHIECQLRHERAALFLVVSGAVGCQTTHQDDGLGLRIGREVDDDRSAGSIRWLERDIEDGDLYIEVSSRTCASSERPQLRAAANAKHLRVGHSAPSALARCQPCRCRARPRTWPTSRRRRTDSCAPPRSSPCPDPCSCRMSIRTAR